VTRDDQEIMVNAGESIDIPIGAAHRVENPGETNLVFIEVQRVNYLGEDDIVRLQDDYGR
jgi:mannose-6-phosphate isomerase